MGKIYFQGTFGAYSHLAAVSIDPDAEILPCKTFDDCFNKASEEPDCRIIIPESNRITGNIGIEYLIFEHRLNIYSEYFQKIEHNLLVIPGTKISDIKVDKIFIGSCTNGRIEDLRVAADLLKGKKIAENVSAMVVPGSGLVKEQAEKEGIDKIFKEAGFEWREPGCSMCLGMNPDQLKPKERCASTSNRNFEGRQGRGGRTHLVSPGMAIAAAINGHLADVRKI